MSTIGRIPNTSPYVKNRTNFVTPEKQAVNQLLQELKESFPEFTFDTASFSNADQIKQYAANQSGLYHVTIDPKILAEMAENEEVRQKYEGILSDIRMHQDFYKMLAERNGNKVYAMGTIIDENGKLSYWSASIKQEEKIQQENGIQSPDFSSFYQKKDTKKKNVITVVYKYSFSHDMARIARAKSAQSVRGFIAAKNGEIGKVKATVTDKAEAQQIIKKIKQAIQKGRTKIIRLNKEEELNKRRRIAIKKRKIALTKELSEQLRKKKMARRAMEHCDTIDMNDVFEQKPSETKFRYETKEYEGDSINQISPIGDGSMVSITPSVDSGGVSIEGSIDIMA